MNIKKNNHTLPRMVIKRWEENSGKLFDKDKNEIRNIKKNDYSQKYYYSLGKEDDELENRISIFESYIGNILKHLNNAQGSIELSEKDLKILKLYIILQVCRNDNTSPVIKEDESGIYKNNNYLFGMHLVSSKEEAVKLTSFICDEFEKIKTLNNYDSMLNDGIHLVIVTNKNNEFLVSETTAIIECSMDNDYMFAYVPISPKIGLILAKSKYFLNEEYIEFTKRRFGEKYGNGTPDPYLSEVIEDKKLIFSGKIVDKKVTLNFVELSTKEIYSLNSIIYEDGKNILFCNEKTLKQAEIPNPIRKIIVKW